MEKFYLIKNIIAKEFFKVIIKIIISLLEILHHTLVNNNCIFQLLDKNKKFIHKFHKKKV